MRCSFCSKTVTISAKKINEALNLLFKKSLVQILIKPGKTAIYFVPNVLEIFIIHTNIEAC